MAQPWLPNKKIIDKFALSDKILAYVKDMGLIRSPMQWCCVKLLGALKPFHGSSFGHALSKVYEYITIDEKMVQGQINAFI
jgi:hypothetical protein